MEAFVELEGQRKEDQCMVYAKGDFQAVFQEYNFE